MERYGGGGGDGGGNKMLGGGGGRGYIGHLEEVEVDRESTGRR